MEILTNVYLQMVTLPKKKDLYTRTSFSLFLKNTEMIKKKKTMHEKG